MLFYKQNLSMNCFQWIFTKKKCSDLSPNYLKQETGRIVDCVRNEIKDILSNARFIRASIDELENASKKKNRSVSKSFIFFTIYKGKCENYTLALRKIKELHATTDEIIQIIMNIEND